VYSAPIKRIERDGAQNEQRIKSNPMSTVGHDGIKYLAATTAASRKKRESQIAN